MPLPPKTKEKSPVFENISREKTGIPMQQQVMVPGPPDEEAAAPPRHLPDEEPQPLGEEPAAPPPQPSETGCITQIAKALGQTLPL